MNSFGIRDDSLHERDGFVDDPSGKDEWGGQERGEKSEDGGQNDGMVAPMKSAA